ncbi:hypothetical protein BJ165DRAFT_1479324 [Panaeolus papilionaceus]|nr:hypothetical protein BJ165DRAFT_1479324 [Panaeolus papilionaceus]
MATGLQELAKRHFGFSPSYPNSLIPKSYLATLEQHLAQYPFDDNYTLVKQAKKGYGILTCREQGCNVEIPLTPIVGRRDGGKQAGIGSLAAFHEHMESHPTHKKSCLRRRSQEANQEAQSDAKNVDASIGVGNPSQSSSGRVCEMHNGAIAMTEAPSRKRLLDTAFDTGQREMDDDNEIDLRARKRLKQDQSLTSVSKSPLATKTSTIIEAETSADADQVSNKAPSADSLSEDDDEEPEPARPLSGYELWAQKKLAQVKVKNYWKAIRNGYDPEDFGFGRKGCTPQERFEDQD